MTPSFDTLDVMPMRIRVASIVRKAILSGEYQAGQELSLTEVAEQLGISRTPVREAFQMLASEGLIDLRMNKSAVVKEISLDLIEDHYDMRRMLEGEAIARATRNGMDIAALKALQQSIEEQGSALESEDYRRYNQIFHTSIWQASGSNKLYGFLVSLWNGSSFGRTVSESSHQDISIQEHRRMLEFIEAGDAEGARAEMERHIIRSMENIQASYRLLEAEGKPFDLGMLQTKYRGTI